MATTKGPRYARLPLGLVERLLEQVSAEAALLLVRLRLSQEKRSIPGLLRAGEGGIADAMGLSVATVRRGLRALQVAGLVVVDPAARLVYCVGAVEEDGPRTTQTVKAFGAQLRELPATSAVTQTVIAAVGRALVGADERLTECWQAEAVRLSVSLAPSLTASLDPTPTVSEPPRLGVSQTLLPRSDPDSEDPTPIPTPMPKNGKAAAAPPALPVEALVEAARNVSVITRIAHEVIDVTGVDGDLGDQSEAVKSRCATLAIAYDSRSVMAALESARHQRGLNGQAVRH